MSRTAKVSLFSVLTLVWLPVAACNAEPQAEPKDAAVAPGPFDPKLHADAMMQCFPAYTEVIGAVYDDLEYDLDPSDADLETYKSAAQALENGRFEPYWKSALETYSDSRAAALVSNAWFVPIERRLKAASTAAERREIFKLVVEKTRRCDSILDSWGAPRL